jgi:uroporphyrinogen III methyltransferase / synthase
MSSLKGRRVLITRPVQQADTISERLITLGAIPVSFPTIVIVPDEDQLNLLDRSLRRIDRYDWLVFTSQNAVSVFWGRYEKIHTGLDALKHIGVAAVGPATTRALNEHGIMVETMPDEYVGEALAESMGVVQGKRILIPHAHAARAVLIEELSLKGAQVDEIQLYRSVTNQPEQSCWNELEKGVDYITFTSASTVQGFFDLLGDRAAAVLQLAVTVCIGPITASALQEHGVEAQLMAKKYTAEGLVQAIIAFEEEKSCNESV